MNRIKNIFCFCFLLVSDVIGQQYVAIPIEIDKNFIYARISWVSENMFCIVADKGYNESGFTHFVFHYDSTGTLIHGPRKLQTSYSSQEDYCFSLGRMLYFMEDEKSDMGGDVFRIAAYIGADGILHNERKEVFFISHSKQFKKLENDHPVFESYVGTSKQKALLTYNNDFVDPISESLQFRILEENGNMTSIDTLNLTYKDRLCNIIDVIFDDEKMDVFLLCNILEDAGDKKKKYLKTVFVKYNIVNKDFLEITEDLPVFSKCKVQHIFSDEKIYYSGLKIDETDPDNWSVAFAEIDLINFKVDLAKNNTPNPEYIKGFYNKKKLNNSSIFPIGFSVDEDGSYSAGWIKFYSLQQIPTMYNSPGPNGGMPMIIAPALGIAGMVLLAGVALAINSANNHSVKSDPGIWFNYSPEKEQYTVDTMSNSSNWNNYYTNSMSEFYSGQNGFCLYNDKNEMNKEFSIIKAKKIGFNTDTISKNITEIFPDFPANIIFPGSGYKTSDRSYFIGAYSYSNDLNAKKDTIKEDQLYLIIFE